MHSRARDCKGGQCYPYGRTSRTDAQFSATEQGNARPRMEGLVQISNGAHKRIDLSSKTPTCSKQPGVRGRDRRVWEKEQSRTVSLHRLAARRASQEEEEEQVERQSAGQRRRGHGWGGDGALVVAQRAARHHKSREGEGRKGKVAPHRDGVVAYWRSGTVGDSEWPSGSRRVGTHGL